MNRTLRRSATFTALLILPLLPRSGQSTTCGQPSACAYLPHATVVFLGQAVSEEPQADGSFIARFMVREMFKGDPAAEVSVHSVNGGFGPGPRFKVGEEFLVVADRDSEGQLVASVCNPSLPANLAVGDLNFLRARARGSLPNTILYGLMFTIEMDKGGAMPKFIPMGGKKVAAVAPNVSLETTSDPDGYFEFKNIPPGDYKVSPILPDTLATQSIPARIGPGGCGAARFLVMWDGRISGRALLHDDQPVAEAHLSLINVAGPRDQAVAGYTDKAGHYSFDHVQPGRYVVGLLDTPVEIPSEDFPFPPLFYPDAETPESARVLEVGPGQQLDHIDFNIREYEPRTIRVEALWPDQRPVAGAHVAIEYEENYCWKRACVAMGYYQADDNGRAAFHAYGDGRVRVYATAWDKSGSEWISNFAELDLRNLPFATTVTMVGRNHYGDDRETPR